MVEVELLQIAGELARLESQALNVDARQCVRARHKNATCRSCADYCPTGAINLDEPEMTNPEQCILCGICAAVCPSGVFEIINPSNARLVSQVEEIARSGSSVAFACPNVPADDAGGAVSVSCIGRLDSSIFISAAALGIRRIELVESQCLSCPQEIGRQAVELAVRDANTLLQACAVDAEVVFVSRGCALQGAGTKMESTSQDGNCPIHVDRHRPEVTVQKGKLPTLIPVKRQHLLSSLSRLPRPVVQKEIETELWASLAIGDDCTGCQMCAFFCPTGALARISVEQLPALVFTVANCVNCRLCVDICYSSAITLSPWIDLDRVLTTSSETVWCNKQTSSYEEKLKRLRQFKPA